MTDNDPYQIQTGDTVQHKEHKNCGEVVATTENDPVVAENEVKVDWEDRPREVCGLNIVSRNDLCLILSESPDRFEQQQRLLMGNILLPQCANEDAFLENLQELIEAEFPDSCSVESLQTYEQRGKPDRTKQGSDE